MAARATSNFTGFLYRIANKKKNVYIRSRLDTENDKYYKTLHQIVIPECMEVLKGIPGYPERMKQCIAYTTPAYFDGWNFGVELVYKTVADKDHQTEENIEKARILRALMDMIHTMASVLDDYADKAEYRGGKKVWASICPGGQEAAVYDTYTLDYLIASILKRHFRNDAGYSRMLEQFNTFNGVAAIGQTLEILERSNSTFREEIWKHIVEYKGAKTTGVTGAIGLLHAGIICDDLVSKISNIFSHCGFMYQVWDDFMEIYGNKEQLGKGTPDSECNVKSWASVTAMAHFNAAQAEEFKACYGSSNPVERSRVRTLYDEVDLHGKYLECLMNTRMTIENEISGIPHARIRRACTNYMEWLVGEDTHHVELERLSAL